MIRINRVVCDTCGTCVGVCPVDALVIEFGSLVLHQEICIDCGACVQACPVEAVRNDDD